MNYYTINELSKIGFKSYGENLQLSKFSNIYNPSNIIIGNNVRIDDFCILSAGDEEFILEDYIHLSAGVYIYGTGGIHIKSYSNVSSGSKIFTVNDDYSGDYMVGACVSNKLRNIKKSKIIIEKYVVIGANSVILPGVSIREGVAIGANSFVNKNCDEWSIYCGSPIRFLKERSKKILNLSFPL